MPLKAPKSSVSEGRKGGLPYRAQYRVLDEAARNRRNRQMFEKLEKDNFHEDPHANLVMHKKAPRFDDHSIKPSTSGHGTGPRRHSHKIRQMSFGALIEDDAKSPPPNYTSNVAPQTGDVISNGKVLMRVIQRHFCCVCGFAAPYTCIACGMRYCCVACLQTHKDTRCLKWTA
ncbi:zinc finger HIT domain-containing protein 1 [Brevipalpus obovatus]|uniref:zinc finger HIT domain-containing protein 1 n=1 Tax=Brevipalpus obovatus TaxID=246614 RepID=UPI003D9E8784